MYNFLDKLKLLIPFFIVILFGIIKQLFGDTVLFYVMAGVFASISYYSNKKHKAYISVLWGIISGLLLLIAIMLHEA